MHEWAKEQTRCERGQRPSPRKCWAELLAQANGQQRGIGIYQGTCSLDPDQVQEAAECASSPVPTALLETSIPFPAQQCFLVFGEDHSADGVGEEGDL